MAKVSKKMKQGTKRKLDDNKKANKTALIVIAVILVFFGGCVACALLIDDAENDSDSKEESKQEESKQEENKQEDKEIVDYRIVEEDDVSYAGYSRWSVRVAFSKSVKDTLTEKQFKDTSKKIVNEFAKKKSSPDEINLFCYLEGQNYSGAYSVGKIVAKKDSGYSIENNDYSFNYEVPDESELGGFSLEEQKKIYYEVIEYQRKYPDDPTASSKAYGVVAKKYGTTEEIVLKVSIKGVEENWPMPPL